MPKTKNETPKVEEEKHEETMVETETKVEEVASQPETTVVETEEVVEIAPSPCPTMSGMQGINIGVAIGNAPKKVTEVNGMVIEDY